MSQQQENSSQLSVGKEPWLAVNLSMFFPGIEQIYSENIIMTPLRCRLRHTLCWEITETIVMIATIGALFLKLTLLAKQPKDFGLLNG